uniref:Putative secreted protein n=1 Tax=Ixodes ricinus TaxID=34613 RepID=A0A147BUM6_IXORI
MRATELLLILVFRFGVTEMSGQEFFNRALKAGVSVYSLDPMEMGFDYVVNSALATVRMYQATATGLGTVHRVGENFIWVNNSGTSLKIKIAAQNVTIAVLANVTVGISFFATTATIRIEVFASALQAQLDIEEKSVELKVEDFKIMGAETAEVKSTSIAGSSLAYTATRQTLESNIRSFLNTSLNAQTLGAIKTKLEELQKALMV